ncbi:cysteine hydrolase [Pusillimonas sp. DMV24BSW_D]|uniref:cysteine hydrolase family protein n=1 Tax=Neopusillimonas aestuarii TaxID=2716226 RepID=UPI00140DA902|nr:isochorismatase family cysteine hydrolase [Pusillimonas sp. DMV24BSW_D]QIM47739.1 cysteine hydrolase [Pusillimonas sp. DMV24BSW_D]
MTATKTVAPLSELLTSGSAALLIVDMQNDFCAPGGYIDAVMGKDVAAAATICDNLIALVSAARTASVPVIWIGSDYSPQRIPAAMQRKLDQRAITAVCCEPGTWGAQWFGVTPMPDESVVIKHAYSGFSNTPLHGVLQEKNIETLVFAGVQTQVCVESTVREAHSLGYIAAVVKDAVASHTPPLHEASLMNMQFLFGELCETTDVVAQWAPRSLS